MGEETKTSYGVSTRLLRIVSNFLIVVIILLTLILKYRYGVLVITAQPYYTNFYRANDFLERLILFLTFAHIVFAIFRSRTIEKIMIRIEKVPSLSRPLIFFGINLILLLMLIMLALNQEMFRRGIDVFIFSLLVYIIRDFLYFRGIERVMYNSPIPDLKSNNK